MPSAPVTDWKVIVGTILMIVVGRLVDKYLPARKARRTPPDDDATPGA